MRTRTLWLVCLALYAAPARAAEDRADWEVQNGNIHSTSAVNINGWVFYAVGGTVYRKSTQGTALGSYAISPATTIDSFPQAVQLSDGYWYVFVAAQDGKLYKINVNNPAAAAMTIANTGGVSQIVSLRRPTDVGCLVKDSITATPALQLKAYAGGTPYVGSGDLVFVPTHHGCGSATTNMVYAFNAADITTGPVWVFNEFGDYSVDFASEGCSVDYARSYIYCGTNLESGRYQNTVWAIDTNTGNLKWAKNVNSVHARPQLGRSNPEHLYVTDMLGRVHALNPTASAAPAAGGIGVEDWALALNSTPGVYTSQNLWGEWRGDYGNTLYLTDSAGTLYAVYDGGTVEGSGETLWSSVIGGGVKIKSLGSVSPTLGKIYVGADDGAVYQLNMSTGSGEGYHVISGTTPAAAGTYTVTDPTLYISGSGTDINKMVATAYGAGVGWTRQFTVPYSTTTGYAPITCPVANVANNTECKNWGNPPCGDAWCSVNNFCYTKPKPNGTVCSDGNNSTTGDKCVSGECFGKWTAAPDASGCSTNKRACGPGRVCYMAVGPTASWSCVDVDNGSDSFSACGSLTRTCDNSTSLGGATLWGGTRECVNGVCSRDNSYCNPPSPAQLRTYRDTLGNPNGRYASGIDFARLPVTGKTGTCIGYLSTYQAGFGVASINFKGTTCVSCGKNPLFIAAGTSGDSADFADPLPSSTIVPTKITVKSRGITCGATGDTANVYLVNSTNGNTAFLGTAVMGTPSCVCGSCVDPLFNLTITNPAGIPNYNNGGNMRIRVAPVTGSWFPADADVTVELPKTVPFNGTTCTACGSATGIPLQILAGNSGDSAPFPDPLNGAVTATKITVRVRGISCGVGADTANVYLVNTVTLATTFLGNGSMGTPVCACAGCVDPLLNVTLSDPNGILTYAYNGNMAIRVTSNSGTWYPVDVDVTIAGATENYVRKVLPTDTSGQSQAWTSEFAAGRQVGYMHGVAAILNSNFTAVADVFANFVNRPTVADNAGLGWLLNFNFTVRDMTATFTPLAAPTSCPAGGSCAYKITDFNSGPTAPVWDGVAGGVGERFFIGNYTRNGDLYKITKTGTLNFSSFSVPTLAAGPGWTGTDPPWCSTVGCTADVDRITALAYPAPRVNAGPNLRDALVRIAHGAKLEFFNIDYGVAAPQPFIAYTLNFKSTAQPGDAKTSPGSMTQSGVGGVPWLPANSIATIVSITADPLNGTNDTYVELRDTNGKNFLVHVRGDDFSARPLAAYTDTLGRLHPGVLAEMGITSVTGNYTMPATSYALDGRLSAGSQVALHRLQPVNPVAPRTNSTAGLVQLPLVP